MNYSKSTQLRQQMFLSDCPYSYCCVAQKKIILLFEISYKFTKNKNYNIKTYRNQNEHFSIQ